MKPSTKYANSNKYKPSNYSPPTPTSSNSSKYSTMNPQVVPPTHRQTRTSLRTHGQKSIRIPRHTQNSHQPQTQNLHVPTPTIHRIHPRQRHLPQRHQTRKCSHRQRSHQTRRLRLLQRYTSSHPGIYSAPPYT